MHPCAISLAVAAFLVLLLQPEAIVTPGFQMSFAATAALVALVEAWPARPREIAIPWPILIFQKATAWVGAAILASLVAGAATGPFAMQHFNRTAMYGLLANLAAAPASDFVIMPALALGALLEPLGLGAPFLWLAGQGIVHFGIDSMRPGPEGRVNALVHKACLELDITHIESLCNLEALIGQGEFRFIGLPLKWRGGTGSPIRAVAVFEE